MMNNMRKRPVLPVKANPRAAAAVAKPMPAKGMMPAKRAMPTQARVPVAAAKGMAMRNKPRNA